MNNLGGNNQEPQQKPPKILFLGGLSGAGKSWFSGHWLVERHNWLWIEIDVPIRHNTWRDGIDANGLRAVWDAFVAEDENYPLCRPKPLHEELSRRAGRFDHVVVSFGSGQVFKEKHLKAGSGLFCFAYLFGRADLCLQEFLERNRKTLTMAGVGHLWNAENIRAARESWNDCNRGLLQELNQPTAIVPTLEAFRPDGTRRDPDEIYREVLSLIGESASIGGQPQS